MALQFGPKKSQLGQRLMAAGASPERTQKFLEQKAFETGQPMGMPTVSTKPQGPNEWYDEEYAAASSSLFPGGFKPPTPDDANFKSYYDIVYGKGAYDKFTTKAQSQAFATNAPTFNKAIKAPVGSYEYVIANGIKDGLSPEVVYESALGIKNLIGTRTDAAVNSYVYKLFDEYTKAQNSLQDIYAKQLANNKDYKFGLPDPKLRYGITTNLSAGQVDVLTNPTAAKAYAAYQKTTQDPQKLSQYKQFLLTKVNERKLTPWKDEAARRDYLKGKKIGG